jgi:hypothetical protein
MLPLSVTDEGYFRTASCGLNLISTFLLILGAVCQSTQCKYVYTVHYCFIMNMWFLRYHHTTLCALGTTRSTVNVEISKTLEYHFFSSQFEIIV